MCECGVCAVLPIPLSRARELHQRVMTSVRKNMTNAFTPSINKTGDIVTLGQVEYRWRDGEMYVRPEGGDLIRTEWNQVPQAVRDALCERIP